jgi:hypothetical protein
MAAYIRFRQAVADALGILAQLEDPDEDPRAFETAVNKIREQAGQRSDWSIDTSEPFGYTDLLEHYFS